MRSTCAGDPSKAVRAHTSAKKKAGICSIVSGYSDTMTNCSAVASISSRIACARASPQRSTARVQALGPLLGGQYRYGLGHRNLHGSVLTPLSCPPASYALRSPRSENPEEVGS